ncbi:K(+)-transporting ATPase subunit F [Hyphomicrobium sp. LHD-15]|nr:K(+)-transporting ATPase subunit F [Hyphomicrobium sp. LHD-15]MDQ8698723.1 K(+)-transporting ATPase subunit F [Hyphomicrobium sp. LHD-15]
MPRRATGCEASMSDPVIGLAVAIGLGVYLVYTLVRPEKF